jgi:broad specificity phosphatase PhoE
MKTLTIRRHTQRTKPGQNLSQKGINLAKLTAPNTQDFTIVATANIPRAIQTAAVFGYAVTLLDDALGHLPREIFEKCAWPNGFSQMSAALSNHKNVADFAQRQADLWKNIVKQTPSSGNALIISHGAIIELGMLASLPNADHTEWGAAIGYCEGILLTFQGTKIHGEILRVPDKFYQLEN